MPLFGVTREPGENHFSTGGGQHAGDLDMHALANAFATSRYHDHRPILEISNGLQSIGGWLLSAHLS